MDRKGILLVVSGFSGAGKGTLMKELVSRYDNYALSISATTRSPREGELDGREYFFRTKEEFEQMIADDRRHRSRSQTCQEIQRFLRGHIEHHQIGYKEQQCPAQVAGHQIGRASCRERV